MDLHGSAHFSPKTFLLTPIREVWQRVGVSDNDIPVNLMKIWSERLQRAGDTSSHRGGQRRFPHLETATRHQDFPGTFPFPFTFQGTQPPRGKHRSHVAALVPAVPRLAELRGPPGVAAGVPAALHDGNGPRLFKNKDSKICSCNRAGSCPTPPGSGWDAGRSLGNASTLPSSIHKGQGYRQGANPWGAQAAALRLWFFNVSELTPCNSLSPAVIKPCEHLGQDKNYSLLKSMGEARCFPPLPFMASSGMSLVAVGVSPILFLAFG